jgi:RHS repeat-associated protein
LGFKTIYSYDANGNKISEEKIGSGRKLTFAYDCENRLTKETECFEDNVLTTSNFYDPMGNKVGVIDAFNQKSSYKYDAASRQISATDQHGYTVLKAYDSRNNVIKHVDQEGYLTETQYNLNGDPLFIHYPDGTHKRFTYNKHGHLTKEIERDGHYTEYELDYQGRVKVATTFAADGTYLKTIQKVYKGPSLISEIDAMGNTISYTYDGGGRLTSKQNGEKLTQYEYDSLGRLSKTVTDERIEVSEFDFCDRAIEERKEDHQGCIYSKVTYQYDINGNCISTKNYCQVDSFSETKTLYNPKNQPLQITDGCGNQTSFCYEYSDHLKKESIDSLGRRKVEIFDATERLKEVSIFSEKGILVACHRLEYEGRGNEVSRKEDILLEGQKIGEYCIETFYDCMGQKLFVIEQNKKTTNYVYYAGRLSKIINPDGVILHHVYDELGRLLTLHSSDGSIEYNYTYDLNDNLLIAEDSINQTITKRSYDAYNRLISETQATGLEINYTYDTQDRLKAVEFNNRKIRYTYGPTALISAECHKDNLFLYKYQQTTDWRGKVRNCQLPKDSSIAYNWDMMGRCISIKSPFYTQFNTYDSVGNLTDVFVNDSLGEYTTRFTYDELNQLTSEDGFFHDQYNFDSMRNRRNRNGAANVITDLNQVAETDSECYEYDDNGRRTAKGDVAYTYDALGRLLKVAIGDASISYAYDPFGRLIERSSPERKVHFLYQFDTEIAAFEGDNMTEFKAVYGTQSPFAFELNNQLYSLVRNHRGDICELYNEDSSSTYRYNAFGEFIHEGNVLSPWLFSGQRYDSGIGLYSYAKRYYDPALGVWLTPDPLGFVDGPNLYCYVNNNPLLYVDPYGLWREHISDIGRNTKGFFRGFTRGAIDDTTWNVSNRVLGEYKPTTRYESFGHHAGTAASIVASIAYGGAELKLLRGSVQLFKRVAFKSSVRAVKVRKVSCQIVKASIQKKTRRAFNNTIRKPPYCGKSLGCDATKSPGPDFVWKGNSKGSWFNAKTHESLRPDFNHPPPIEPHWDYSKSKPDTNVRLFLNGKWEYK